MPEAGSPNDLDWLGRLLLASPLLPDSALHRYWLTLLPRLDEDERFELAACLRGVELAAGNLAAMTRLAHPPEASEPLPREHSPLELPPSPGQPVGPDGDRVARPKGAEEKLQATERLRAYAAWVKAAGPWRLWCACLPLLEFETAGRAPGASCLDMIAGEPMGVSERPTETADRLADELAIEIAAGPCAVILDLAAELSVTVAGNLARRKIARPVLLLNRWPRPQAVVPSEGLVKALVREAPPNGGSLGGCTALAIALDGERDAPLSTRLINDPRADNRYALYPEDLPDAASLVARGIGRVLYVTNRSVPSQTGVIPPLVKPFSSAGLTVQVRMPGLDPGRPGTGA